MYAFAGAYDACVRMDADEDGITPGGVDDTGRDVGDFHRDPAWRVGTRQNLTESGITISINRGFLCRKHCGGFLF